MSSPTPHATDSHEWLAQVIAAVGSLVEMAGEATDAARIDVITLLERLGAATAAAQAAEMVRFADSQVDGQGALGIPAHRLGRGIADQIALACRVSPVEGSRRLGNARALVRDLPQTLSAFQAGDSNVATARQVVDETIHLDPATSTATPTAAPPRTRTAAASGSGANLVRELPGWQV